MIFVERCSFLRKCFICLHRLGWGHGMSLVRAFETWTTNSEIHSSDQGWVPPVKANWTLLDIGMSDWTEWSNLFFRKLWKPGNIFIGLFRLLEGGRDKRRNEATESDVMSILGQCCMRLSLNKNYLYLEFKTITEFLL